VTTSFATGLGHYYTLDCDLWQELAPDRDAMSCLDCLQRRLGRPLLDEDFIATPLEILCRLLQRSKRG
jgi:hypothetical protein